MIFPICRREHDRRGIPKNHACWVINDGILGWAVFDADGLRDAWDTTRLDLPYYVPANLPFRVVWDSEKIRDKGTPERPIRLSMWRMRLMRGHLEVRCYQTIGKKIPNWMAKAQHRINKHQPVTLAELEAVTGLESRRVHKEALRSARREKASCTNDPGRGVS